MNTNTGEVYRSLDDLRKPLNKGEIITGINSDTANKLENLSSFKAQRFARILTEIKTLRPDLDPDQQEQFAWSRV